MARSAAIEESNGTASRPSTRSVATRPTATPKVSSSKIQPSRACSRRRSNSSATPGCRPVPPMSRRPGPSVPGEFDPPSDPGAELGRNRGVLEHPGAVEIVEIVQGVGDVVGDVHHRALHRLLQRPDLRVGGQHSAQLGDVQHVGRRTWPNRMPSSPTPPPRGGGVSELGCGSGYSVPGPGVLQHARADRGRQVQTLAVAAVHVEFGQDPEGLRVALEAVGQPEPGPGDPIQDPLAEMTERRVTQVVRAGRGLHHHGITAAQLLRQRRRPVRPATRWRWPGRPR